MTGSVRKRGDKWYYSFEAAKVDGKRKRIERVGGRTKKETETALRKALEEYSQNGEYFEIKDISVVDYFNYWFDNYVLLNCKYYTQRNYKFSLNKYILPEFKNYKLKHLTPQLLQEFVNKKYLQGMTKNYLKSILTPMVSALKYAVYPCKFIKDNPMNYIKFPKYNQSESNRTIITIQDFKKITDKYPFGSYPYIPLVIGYYTGCRISEVIGLSWDDVNFTNNTISINKILLKKENKIYIGPPKTKSSIRTIKIGQTLLNILKKHKSYQNENKLKYGSHYMNQYSKKDLIISSKENLSLPKISFICTKENGTLLTPNQIHRIGRIINDKLNIPFNFHSLRHTHATLLIENGANIKDVQHRLGHSNVQITLNTYTHVTPKMSEETVQIFENLPTT